MATGAVEQWARRFVALSLLLGLPLLVVLGAVPASTAASLHRPAAGTVYVTNLNTNSVTVINAVTRKVTVISGAGRGMNGPLGIAIAPNSETAYVTNSLGNTVTPIDLTASPPIIEAPIHVGSGPAAIAITPRGETAYVTNFNSNTVTPIDLTTTPPTPGRPIRVGTGPWSIAVSPDGRTVCVSDTESSAVSVINTVTRQVTSVQVGARPQAVAISPNGSYAYVANGDSVTPIRLDRSPAVAERTIPVGHGPVGLAISPNGRSAFTANSNDTLTPINLTTTPPAPGAPIAVGTLSQPDGIAISPDGATAYAANASDHVTPINLRADPPMPEAPIAVGTASFGIAIAPDQAPIARLTVSPSRAGHRTSFSAVRSSAVNGPIALYTWSFGDGTTASTLAPRTTHVYTQPGAYQASVTETTRDGTSLRSTFTGQTVSNNGGPTASTTASFRVSSALVLSPPKGSPGMALTLRDTTFASGCQSVYVFFDKNLITQTRPIGALIVDRQVVVPGDARVGGHHIELSCSTSRRWLLTAPFAVTATKNHLSEFSVAMPSPGELKHHLAGAGAVSLILLLISRIVSGGFPSEWLDRTYAENRERISRPLRRRFPRLFLDREAPRSSWSRLATSTALFLGFILGASLINSFLVPNFGLNRTTLWLFLGQCVGVAVVTLSSQLPIAVAGIRRRRRVHVQVLLGGMIIAVFCVVTSRLLGLSPGYCYGLIAVFLILPETDPADDGRLHAMASIVVMVVSTAAFFLTAPVYHAATGPSPSPFVLILNPALNVIFLAGFASLAFGMFPLPFMPGRHVAKWNETAWLAISGIGLIGFVAVLLSPGSGTTNELHHVALVPMLSAFVIFALISLAFMAYFHVRPDRESEAVERHAPAGLFDQPETASD